MLEHIIQGFYSNKYLIEIYIIIRQEFKQQYINHINYLETKYNNVKFLYIDKKTEGTTSTALHFFDILNNDDPVLLANCDQIVDIELDNFLDYSLNFDGSLLIFDNEKSNKWSFVEIKNDLVTNVVAKQPISDLAICGWYFWAKSIDFIKYGILQIVTQTKVGGEYYLCPVYNFAIKENKKIGFYKIKKQKMHGVGTPEDLETFINNNKKMRFKTRESYEKNDVKDKENNFKNNKKISSTIDTFRELQGNKTNINDED